MRDDAQRLLAEALGLPAEERAEVGAVLLASVGGPANDIQRAWVDEARRRFAEVERGEVATSPWFEARKRIFVR